VSGTAGVLLTGGRLSSFACSPVLPLTCSSRPSADSGRLDTSRTVPGGGGGAGGAYPASAGAVSGRLSPLQ